MNSIDQQLPEPAPAKNRIARYDKYFDQRTLAETLRKTNKPPKNRFSNKNPVLVVTRNIDHKGQHTHTTISIKSEALCKVLMELNEDMEGLELARDEAEPELFFHSCFGLRGRLAEEQSKDAPEDALIDDLKTALQYIEEDHTKNITDFTRLTAHQQITYDLLWALFAPNTLLYHYHHDTEQVQILLARRLNYSQRKNRSLYAYIECDVISDDGTSFGLARDNSLEIDKFSGACKIQVLPVYPLIYHPDQDAIREHAIKRGKKFAAMNWPSYREISGVAMRESIRESTTQHEVFRNIFKFHTYGRVMIDPATFRMFEPNCGFNLPVHSKLGRDELTDEQYMICTPILLGFCFGVKMWGGFAMDRLKDIIWSDDPFRTLVLGAKQKTLVHALVKQHVARSTTFDDVIQGKGKGIIGLLSGKPGCGKTLTAEAVAEITHRPLYAVSAGELGTETTALDQRLSRILELAQMWDAVLLLDEADVFLQQRSGTDVNRHAIVSIFLRQLEYYQGILILTTNMIDQCDAAFESRIHFSIHYPDLDFESRKSIWKKHFGNATKDASGISDEDLDRLAHHQMNGRQIKNAVSSALCIALENKEQLSAEHVEAVLDVVSDWKSSRPGLLDSMI
jgi:hypothetical protein